MIRNLQVLAIAFLVSSASLAFGQVEVDDAKDSKAAKSVVGDDGASLTYVGSKVRACKRVGFESTLIKLPESISEKELLEKVNELNNDKNIDGYIICIPNADPGFDWIFSHKIRGLITAWGGANSHMAIRAGELGLPAVIGSGEVLYEKWSTAKRVFINCAAKKVEIIE